MGTWYRVKLVSEEPLLPPVHDQIEQEIRQRLDRIDRTLSTYRDDSEVSRFNRAAPGESVELGPEGVAVLTLALQVSEDTGGAFDPTVGPLVDAWGFGPDGPQERPSEAELDALRRRVGWRQLALRDGALDKSAPGVEVDLSAIAKGYAVDVVHEGLETREDLLGVMVEVGGEVRVSGVNAQRSPWRVAIESPDAERRGIQRVLELEAEAIATSGDYRNFYERDGRRFSHILDPATGEPVHHRAASVSVVTEECAAADAWATALLVMGPQRGLAWAVERNLSALFLVYNDEGGVDELATPEMAQRLGIAVDPRGRVAGSPAPPPLSRSPSLRDGRPLAS